MPLPGLVAYPIAMIPFCSKVWVAHRREEASLPDCCKSSRM